MQDHHCCGCMPSRANESCVCRCRKLITQYLDNTASTVLTSHTGQTSLFNTCTHSSLQGAGGVLSLDLQMGLRQPECLDSWETSTDVLPSSSMEGDCSLASTTLVLAMGMLLPMSPSSSGLAVCHILLPATKRFSDCCFPFSPHSRTAQL